jgi:hypothetical protein
MIAIFYQNSWQCCLTFLLSVETFNIPYCRHVGGSISAHPSSYTLRSLQDSGTMLHQRRLDAVNVENPGLALTTNVQWISGDAEELIVALRFQLHVQSVG